MKKQINLNNLKTIEQEIALLPKTYNEAVRESSLWFLRFLGPIPGYFLDKDIMAHKTFICKQDNHILKHTVKPETSFWSSEMKYDTIVSIDVTSDYEIVDELNIATAPDHTL